MTDARMAVRCRDVEKDFGAGDVRVHALRGVNLDIPVGRLTMLVGPSGCGKTTLLCVISGLLDSTHGEVELFGERVASLSASDQARFRLANLGFVFQQFNLLPSLTAAENVAVPLLARGMRRADAVRRATALLQTLGLGDRAAAFTSQLSGGQQQRVALGRALVHEPRLVVCDEPTAALDAVAGRGVMELLAATAVRPDRAVIVVTHDNRVFSFGDTIAEMDDGRIVTTRDQHSTNAVEQETP